MKKSRVTTPFAEARVDCASGRDVLTFALQAGVSRTTIYALLPEYQPRSVMIGKRRVITESPADWLQRMAASGGATTRQQRPGAGKRP